MPPYNQSFPDAYRSQRPGADPGEPKSFLQTIGFNRKTRRKKNTEKENKEEIKNNIKQDNIDIDALGVDEIAKMIYKHMEYGKKYNADSFEELELKMNDIISSFTILEMFGAIKSLPGGFFEKN